MICHYEIEGLLITVCFCSEKGFDKEENQDSVRVADSKNSVSVSICDGLGSAKKSAEGSNFASALLSNLVLEDSFDKRQFQKEWLERFDENPSLYNTTAKFICLRATAIKYGGIGDGLIAMMADGKMVTSLDHGAYSNQTSCVYDPFFQMRFQTCEEPFQDECIALISTDGFSEDLVDETIQDLLLEAKDSLKQEDKANEFDESLASLLKNWPNKTNGDDKTVAFVLATRKESL